MLNENGGGRVFFFEKALTLLISPICLYTRLIHAVAGREADPEREREREDESRQRLARTRVPAWERKYTRRETEREGE